MMAIDLPLKLLVREDDAGQLWIANNDRGSMENGTQ